MSGEYENFHPVVRDLADELEHCTIFLRRVNALIESRGGGSSAQIAVEERERCAQLVERFAAEQYGVLDSNSRHRLSLLVDEIRCPRG